MNKRFPTYYLFRLCLRSSLIALMLSRSFAQQAPPNNPPALLIEKAPNSLNRPSFADARSQVDQPIGDPVEYAYSDHSSLALGRGFNPKDVTANPKASCILWTSEQLDPGPPSTNFNMLYVNDYDEMNFALGVDSKVDASYLGNSAGGHTKVDASFLTKKNAITVILRANTNFGRWGIKAGATLTDQAKVWLGKPKVFEDRCGSRYVSIEGRGASVSALITLDSVSKDVKLAFESEMSGSGGWGPLSAKASLIFRTEAKSASRQDRLEVQVFATGGSGLGGLSDTVKSLMKSDTGIEQATQALGTFLAQFNSTNAAVVYYRVSSMEDFGWDPAGIDPWTDLKEQKLRALAQEYRRVSYLLDIENHVIDGSHPLALVLDTTDIDWIKQDIPRSQAYRDNLAKYHQTCKLNSSPIDPFCEFPFNRVSPVVEAFLFILNPPRVVIHVVGLSEDQTKVVLNAPPEFRLGYAKQFENRRNRRCGANYWSIRVIFEGELCRRRWYGA